MINTIKQFFEKNIKPASDKPEKVSEHSLQLATAALFIEMMRADTKISEHEQKTIVNSIRSKFNLSEEETDTLLELAEEAGLKSGPMYAYSAGGHIYGYQEELARLRTLKPKN